MNVRLNAGRVIAKILKDGVSLTAALELELEKISSAQDKAFIQALCYGVMRRYFLLDHILGQQLLTKPIKDLEVKSLALAGMFQLGFTNVKPHAAVAETVAAVPRKKNWAKPLLNGVLRNFQRRQQECIDQAKACKVGRYDHPQWLINQIQQDWPDHADSIMEANNCQAPMTLRVNLNRVKRAQYIETLSANNLPAKEISICESAVALDLPVAIEKLPGFKQGLVSVQDTAAQLAANLLELEAGQRVLDICTAPGGKAAHILENQPHLEKLIAIDIDDQRMKKVRENFTRLELDAECIVADATASDWWDGQKFDRILLDAPCSATGVIRRHPDIKVLRRSTDIAPIAEIQKKILNSVWPMLNKHGILVYATCSILKQENELQIMSFIDEVEDAEDYLIDADWGESRLFGRQIFPGDHQMDGFYYGRLRKS